VIVDRDVQMTVTPIHSSHRHSLSFFLLFFLSLSLTFSLSRTAAGAGDRRMRMQMPAFTSAYACMSNEEAQGVRTETCECMLNEKRESEEEREGRANACRKNE